MANKYSQVKNFHFVGYISFKEENLIKSKNGSTWRKLSFSVTDGNNSQFVEVNEFGAGKDFKVKVPNDDNGYDDLVVEWYERNEKDVLDKVASFSKKYVLGKTLIHNHDVIEEVLKAIRDGRLEKAKFEDGKVVSGTKVSVNGQIKFNYYNGNVSQVYEFSRMNIVKQDAPTEFTGGISMVFGKNAVKDDVKNNRLVVNGYVAEYNKTLFGEKTPTGLLPQTFVLNYNDVAKGTALKKFLETKLVVKDDKMKVIRFDVQFLKGAKEASVADFKPTKEQMELVDLGLMTIEELMETVKPVGRKVTETQIVMETVKPVGRKVTETQIVKINISGSFEKVFVQTDFTMKNVYKEETEEDMYEEEDVDIFSTLDLDEDSLPF